MYIMPESFFNNIKMAGEEIEFSETLTYDAFTIIK